MNRKYLLWGAIGIVAYLVYENYFAPDAGATNPNTNTDLGGIDFGILDPSNW